MTSERQRIRLELVPVAGEWRAPVEYRLRRALKCLLRSFGLRVVTIEWKGKGGAGASPQDAAP